MQSADCNPNNQETPSTSSLTSLSMASTSRRPSLTLISTRTGRRTSIHHDTEFADRMNAYIVSPLIPLPKPPPPTPPLLPPPPAATPTGSSTTHRRPVRRRNPTLDRLLQPASSAESTVTSPSQMIIGKLRSLKLRLQRHASLQGRGWPPRDFVLMEEVAARNSSQSSRGDKQQQPQTFRDSSPVDGIVCTENDIRDIVSDLLLRQEGAEGDSGSSSSGGGCQQHRQLIGVVPLPESPTRSLVCFIDPRRSKLVPDARNLQICRSCLRPLPAEQSKQQQRQQQQPQPKEILFDENGQTWDVYGADLDPDLLGRAIQNHLAARREKSGSAD